MNPFPISSVVHGDCAKVMQGMEPASVDSIPIHPQIRFAIATVPGVSPNGDNDVWLKLAFAHCTRAFCLSFYNSIAGSPNNVLAPSRKWEMMLV